MVSFKNKEGPQVPIDLLLQANLSSFSIKGHWHIKEFMFKPRVMNNIKCVLWDAYTKSFILRKRGKELLC